MFKLSVDINQIADVDHKKFSKLKHVINRYWLVMKYAAEITYITKKYIMSLAYESLAISSSNKGTTHSVHKKGKDKVTISSFVTEEPPSALVIIQMPKEMLPKIEALLERKGYSSKYFSLVH